MPSSVQPCRGRLIVVVAVVQDGVGAHPCLQVKEVRLERTRRLSEAMFTNSEPRISTDQSMNETPGPSSLRTRAALRKYRSDNEAVMKDRATVRPAGVRMSLPRLSHTGRWLRDTFSAQVKETAAVPNAQVEMQTEPFPSVKEPAPGVDRLVRHDSWQKRQTVDGDQASTTNHSTPAGKADSDSSEDELTLVPNRRGSCNMDES